MIARPLFRRALCAAALTALFSARVHAGPTDDAWQHVQELQHEAEADAPRGVNEVEFYEPRKAALHQAAADFAAGHPDDPRRWDADLAAIRSQHFPADAGERRAIFEHNEALLKPILAAPDAPAATKQAAERAVIRQHLDHLDLLTSPEQAVALEGRLSDYLARFPDDPKAPNMQVRRLDLWQRADPAKAVALLDEMATSSDDKIAAAARGRQAQRALVGQPLDWKLPALGGGIIDLPALRGRAVLVQFWASWCPDCNREMPVILSTYRQFHDRGLEVVGISLDQDKEALLSTVKKKGIAWPQYFDGNGWNNDVAVRFGVRGIPELWLVDTAGRVVATGVQVDQLVTLIPPLLPAATAAR